MTFLFLLFRITMEPAWDTVACNSTHSVLYTINRNKDVLFMN